MSVGVENDVEVTREEKQARLAETYERVRGFTMRLAEPLAVEDLVIQSMPDVSPTKWHLAHTTWFFETFILKQVPDYQPFHRHYEYLFNSYYNGVGEQFPRAKRGLLSRPTVSEVFQYRQRVDGAMMMWLKDGILSENVLSLIELGLHHEQQHQELILTDIKHVLSQHPLFPVYDGSLHLHESQMVRKRSSLAFSSGLYEIGHSGAGFAYDNEGPRHRVYLNNFQVDDRLITNGEFIGFLEDGGYSRPELWLSMGWTHLVENGWDAPMYWTRLDREWHTFTLVGLRAVDENAPVTHLSFFEADAFARWAGRRLPSEAEWEIAARGETVAGRFVDTLLGQKEVPHPASHDDATGLPSRQFYGDVWEWTSSPYTPYPGFKPTEGAVGEYNGKFMCNQYVLRGGSCATSSDHIRPTYRNFFPPEARWQFSGLRLAD